MKIKFCGAAQIVTGSCYYLEVGKCKFLVDCGMFQGTKDTTRLNYQPFLFNPKKIDFVFLTHAHIDHSGLLPKLVKQGFKGKIYATDATIDLCRIMLEDSAHVQEMDNEKENRRLEREGKQLRHPLYSKQDAADVQPLFQKVVYNQLLEITPTIKARYQDAGHIIGSAMIELFLKENGREVRIVFSGDLGQWGAPIVRDPTLIKEADYVLVESTYGDRKHGDIGFRDEELLQHVLKTFKKNGKLLIPSFAIERTQELLYSFNKLVKQKKFPDEKIFLDSPLAIKATEVFKRHKEFFDQEALYKYKDPFSFPQLEYTPTADDSKKLNSYAKPCIIIAGSGMATAGRIRHHLKNHLDNPKNTVLFVGYQAEGTTGRYLLEGAKVAKFWGMTIPVEAEITKINSFSAHADVDDLLRWMGGFEKNPKKVFVVHGEKRSCSAFRQTLRSKGFKPVIPAIGDEVIL